MANIFLINLITAQILNTYQQLAIALENSKKFSDDNTDKEISNIVEEVKRTTMDLNTNQVVVAVQKNVLQTQEKIIAKLNQEYNQTEMERLANLLALLQKNRLKMARYMLMLRRKKRHKDFILACEKIIQAEKQAKLLAMLAMQKRAEQYANINIVVNNFAQSLSGHQNNILLHIYSMVQLKQEIMQCTHLNLKQKMEVGDLIDVDIAISAQCHQIIEQVKTGVQKADAALRSLISTLLKDEDNVDIDAMDDASIIKKITELHANIGIMQRDAKMLAQGQSAADKASIINAISESKILEAKINKVCNEIGDLSLEIEKLGRDMLKDDGNYDQLYAQMKAKIHVKTQLVAELGKFKNEKDKLNNEILQHCHRTLASNISDAPGKSIQAKSNLETLQTKDKSTPESKTIVGAELKQTLDDIDWLERHVQQMQDLCAYHDKNMENYNGILALNAENDPDTAKALYDQTLEAIEQVIAEDDITEETYNQVEALIKAYKNAVNGAGNQIKQDDITSRTQPLTFGFNAIKAQTSGTSTANSQEEDAPTQAATQTTRPTL